MATFWENKYINAEKSIQFIQETHSEVLRGLHEQIDNLQKQCAGKNPKPLPRKIKLVEFSKFFNIIK
jgi:hypothetical protein